MPTEITILPACFLLGKAVAVYAGHVVEGHLVHVGRRALLVRGGSDIVGKALLVSLLLCGLGS